MRFLLMLYKTEEMGGGERVILNVSKLIKVKNVFSFSTKRCYSKKEIERIVLEKYRIKIKFDEYSCIHIPLSKIIKNKYKEYFALKKFIAKLDEKYDIGIVHLSDVYKIAEKSRKKLIYFVGPGPTLKMNLIKKIIKEIYFLPFKLFLRAKKIKNKEVLIIPVSKFIKEKLERRGIKVYKVIYPPVDVKIFKWKGEKKKKNRIIYFSRISRDKRQHLLIELAKKLPEYEFIIAGSVSDERYLKELEKIKVENVKIMKNLSIKELTKIVKSSNFYVHMAENDTMPSTVIEAMAAGCVPIVHKSGGPWIDVVERGKYGFGWEKVDDIANIIRKMENIRKIRKKVIERSKVFSQENFLKNVKEVLK